MEFINAFLPKNAVKEVDELLVYDGPSPCPAGGTKNLSNFAILLNLVSNNIYRPT